MSQKKLGPRAVPARGKGNLHCGFYDEITDEQHNHYFETMEDMRKHIAEMPHLHVGSGPCNDCGCPDTPQQWYGKLHPNKMVAPIVCSGCITNRKSQMENSK